MASPRIATRIVGLLVFGLLVAPASQAGAVVGSTPVAGVETNGAVNAITSSGNRVFIGGSFTRAGIPTGSGADLSQADGARNPAFARPDGTILATVSDGAGGWFIGGSFARVGGFLRNNLAHLRADGSVDPAFDPNVNDVVDTLVLVGGKLFAGGGFTVVNGASVGTGGVARGPLAAFDASAGTVITGFDPNVGGEVLALAISGSTLYAGGSFTTVNGAIVRNRVAAFDVATGVATSFNPNIASTVRTLAVANGALYVGGAFTTVNGSTARNRLAAFDTTTGSATSFDPNINTPGSVVAALVVADGTVYAGGSFTRVNAASLLRQRLAAFDATTGAATSFSPDITNPDSVVSSLALSGTTLFVGGDFTEVQFHSVARNRLAAYDTVGGGLVTSFDPNLDGAVKALAVAGSRVYAGGGFQFANGDTVRTGLASVNADGTLDASFAPTYADGGAVYSLALSGDTLYVGGTFSYRLMALDAATGVRFVGFNPGVGSFIVAAIVVAGGKVFAGGDFTRIAPSIIVRNRIAAFDATTGALDPFDPNVNGTVWTLALLNGKIYAGGDFTVVNGASVAGGGKARNRLAAFDPVTGLVDPAFNPNLNSTVSALLPSAGRLFVGGAFTTINGSTTRNRLAAVDLTTGAVDGAFDPNLNDSVASLALSGDTLYAGGAFTKVNATTTRNRLAAFDAAKGAVLGGFDPSAGNLVNALLVFGPRLYAGGTFTSIGGNPDLRLARFAEAPSAPEVVSGSASAITTQTASLVGSVDPNGAATAYVFEYGPTLSFGSITAPVSAGAADDPVAVVGGLAGLASHTTYYYRLVATNAVGTIFGAVRSFVTDGTPVAPVATTLASSPDTTTATLSATVNPNGQQTAYTFEYGTSTSFGFISPVVALDAAIADEPVTATLTGLSPGTTYLYRVVASNATGTSAGAVRSFTTTPGAS